MNRYGNSGSACLQRVLFSYSKELFALECKSVVVVRENSAVREEPSKLYTLEDISLFLIEGGHNSRGILNTQSISDMIK